MPHIKELREGPRRASSERGPSHARAFEGAALAKLLTSFVMATRANSDFSPISPEPLPHSVEESTEEPSRCGGGPRGARA